MHDKFDQNHADLMVLVIVPGCIVEVLSRVLVQTVADVFSVHEVGS